MLIIPCWVRRAAVAHKGLIAAEAGRQRQFASPLGNRGLDARKREQIRGQAFILESPNAEKYDPAPSQPVSRRDPGTNRVRVSAYPLDSQPQREAWMTREATRTSRKWTPLSDRHLRRVEGRRGQAFIFESSPIQPCLRKLSHNRKVSVSCPEHGDEP